MPRFFIVFLLASFLIAMVASRPNEDVQALRGKPGRCPSDRGIISICMDTCGGDFDCPGSEKCCHWGCAHHCVPAAFN